VAWRYPAQNFVAYAVEGVVGESVGDWAACCNCHRLIEAGDRNGLLDRSIHRLLEKNPGMREAEAELRHQMGHFHRMFFAHQTGAAVPFPPEWQ
jgi:hypothetical protein